MIAKKWSKLATITVLVVVAIGVAVSLSSRSVTNADKLTNVATVESQRLSDEYVRKVLDPILQKETSALQAEFEAKSKDMTNEDKKKLFDEYQARLDKRKEELVREALDKLKAAISEVAREQGYDLVFERQAVLYGGTDITDAVLEKLNHEPVADTSSQKK